MIKKILLGLLFVGLGFTSFSSAWEFHTVGTLNPSVYNNNYTVGVLTKGAVLTQFLGQGRGVFYIGGTSSNYNVSFFYRNSDKLPYIYYSNKYYSSFYYYEGVLGSYLICPEITSSTTNIYYRNCEKINSSSFDLSSFFSSVQQGVDYYGYNYYDSGRDGAFVLCFSNSSLGKSLCFAAYDDAVFLSDNNYRSLGSNVSFSSIPDSEIGTSPGVGGGGGGSSSSSGGLIDITNNDYFNYFENHSVESFNVSDCYVGTNDLTSPYGTAGLSFNYGTGKTIFDLYDSIYGGGTGLDYIKNVSTWTRVRKSNYGEWFDRTADGTMGVFSEFTLNGVEFLPRDYTGFIFSGRPASLYFMANNLYNIFGHYGDSYKLVGYCDMKLNGTPFNEVFPPGSAVANNVLGATYSNYYNRQYYVDGSGNLVLSREPGDFNIYLSEWLNYNGTGEDYGDYFDGFSNFYDKLDEKFSNINLSNSVGIIPSYILFALFGIILFKIFKH